MSGGLNLDTRNPQTLAPTALSAMPARRFSRASDESLEAALLSMPYIFSQSHRAQIGENLAGSICGSRVVAPETTARPL